MKAYSFYNGYLAIVILLCMPMVKNKNFGKINMAAYNKAMEKIIKKNKGLSVEETLIKLLDEAAKWKNLKDIAGG
jgi:hypothetical protein